VYRGRSFNAFRIWEFPGQTGLQNSDVNPSWQQCAEARGACKTLDPQHLSRVTGNLKLLAGPVRLTEVFAIHLTSRRTRSTSLPEERTSRFLFCMWNLGSGCALFQRTTADESVPCACAATENPCSPFTATNSIPASRRRHECGNVGSPDGNANLGARRTAYRGGRGLSKISVWWRVRSKGRSAPC
jgi:hypothetical protein